GATFAGTPWTWDTTQRTSGTRSHVEPLASGLHLHYFYNDPNQISIAPGDVLFTDVLLDPCNPPREIILQWFHGTEWGRAYWGEDLIDAPRYRIGPLPETGKWVRLEVPAAMLGLNERKISGLAFVLHDGRAWFDHSGKFSRVNLALKKTARQSSDLSPDDPASRAVDGNVTSGHGSMSVTQPLAEQWWEVDLGSVAPMIESIEIRGRTDCCANQTADLTVLVSDTPITASTLTAARALSASGVGVYRNPGAIGSAYTMQVGRSGRYVRVWRGGTDYLSLPEVLVWAPATPAPVNVAAGKFAYAPPSQTFLEYWPEYAVNGSSNDTYNTTGGMFHANASIAPEPYWQVDLGKVEAISKIDIGARTDCCPEQLTGYYVLTSNVPFASASLATTLADPNVSAFYVGSFVPMANVAVNRTARYVRLQKPGSGIIVFTEVRVWSQLTNTKVFALPDTPPTSASSTSFDFKSAYRRFRPGALAVR
ncbi:MAG TPA: discoidin domain-containing protein, partial [Thermoanaerobaculia bacterium]